MTKRNSLITLAQSVGITPVFWRKGTHPHKRSAVYALWEHGQLRAEFTSPDRAIEWLNELKSSGDGLGVTSLGVLLSGPQKRYLKAWALEKDISLSTLCRGILVEAIAARRAGRKPIFSADEFE